MLIKESKNSLNHNPHRYHKSPAPEDYPCTASIRALAASAFASAFTSSASRWALTISLLWVERDAGGVRDINIVGGDGTISCDDVATDDGALTVTDGVNAKRSVIEY